MKQRWKKIEVWFLTFGMKGYVGSVLLLIGSVSLIKNAYTETSINIAINLVLGILWVAIGLGLIVLGVSEKNKESKDSINIYIGKQLFEKGLYGIIVGVVLGIFSMITK